MEFLFSVHPEGMVTCPKTSSSPLRGPSSQGSNGAMGELFCAEVSWRELCTCC